MPILKNHTVVSIARNVKAFLKLEAGITRSGVPEEVRQGQGDSARLRKQLDKSQQQVARLRERLDRSRLQFEHRDRELMELRDNLPGLESGGLAAENVIWMFGSARTGSTWLGDMMRDLDNHTVWFEPLVGELFGRFFHDWNEETHFLTEHIILGAQKSFWRIPVRNFILQSANVRFPAVAKGGYLVIKEPSGSKGAFLLTEALPESRLIFLVRDPRDVVASGLDAWTKGSWLYENTSESKRDREAIFDAHPDEVVKERARVVSLEMESSRLAYEAHEGPKTLVRYEDLKADALETMKRVYSELGIAVGESDLARVVEKHSWDNVPDDQKGESKFFRKGASGGWKEDLTPEQAEIVEKVSAPILDEFYSRG